MKRFERQTVCRHRAQFLRCRSCVAIVIALIMLGLAALNHVGSAAAGNPDTLERAGDTTLIYEGSKCGGHGPCENWAVCQCCGQNGIVGESCEDGEVQCLHQIVQNQAVGTPVSDSQGWSDMVWAPTEPERVCVYYEAFCTGDPETPCWMLPMKQTITCTDYKDPGLEYTCP